MAKPSKGTPADKRLKENRPKRTMPMPSLAHGPVKGMPRNAAGADPYNFASKPWQGN